MEMAEGRVGVGARIVGGFVEQSIAWLSAIALLWTRCLCNHGC